VHVTSTAPATTRDVDQSSGAPSGPSTGAWLTLVATLLAVFMQLLDVSIVNVALPSIAADLGASFSSLQLVITAYTLAFACTLITAARLGDLYGRRKVFLLALASFTVASILCGVSQTSLELEGARVLQGFTAGFMAAQTLAIIATTFPPAQRGRVFGIYGATIGMATILGPTLGGALISWNVLGLQWRAIFLVNVPIGIVALVFGFRNLLDSRSDKAQRLDVPGVVLSAVGLFLLVYPLAEGRERGWPLWLVVMAVASVPVLAAFVLYEKRRGDRDDSPLIELSIFTDRAFAVGSLMALLFFSVLITFFFSVSLTLQAGFGFTALHSGLTTLPFAVGSAVLSASSNTIAQKLGSLVLLLGAGVLAVALTVFAFVLGHEGTTPHWLVLAGPLLLAGAGLGLFIAPLQTVILSGVKQENAGSASGVLPTFQQLGGSVGLAALGVLFFTLIGSAAPQSVTEVRPALVQQLAAVPGLPADAQAQLATTFTRCSAERLASSDPSATPAGCEPPSVPAGTPPAVAQAFQTAGGLLATAGQEVGGRSFLSSEQRTLWTMSGLLVVVMGLALLLPRRTEGHGGGAPAAPAERAGGGGSVGNPDPAHPDAAHPDADRHDADRHDAAHHDAAHHDADHHDAPRVRDSADGAVGGPPAPEHATAGHRPAHSTTAQHGTIAAPAGQPRGRHEA
jgi:EmrB/QacA subfamily drug resistance transporter